MPIGDDFYPYGLEFSDDGRRVLIGMNGTFVRRVLGQDGSKDVQQACVVENRAVLIEEAKSRRSSWDRLDASTFICTLGLSGIPAMDEGQAFPRLGSPGPKVEMKAEG